MKQANVAIFPHIFALIEEAFPSAERRTYEGQKALLSKTNYHLFFQGEEQNVESIMAVWEFSSFIYIEHFAVSKQKRGSGIGSACMKTFLENAKKPVILEVEKPCDSITERRIMFYERIGFHLNPFAYEQPPLQKNYGPLPLHIMSYPSLLTAQQFQEIKTQLYREVYGK